MALTPQTNTTLQEIARVLESVDDIVIVGHINPDGDCTGSQLGLMHALRSLGKKATCVRAERDSIDRRLLFMPGAPEIEYAGDYEGPLGAFVSVDVPTRERIGEAACALADRSPLTITIDHHAVESTMSDYVYVDPDAPSTTSLVWEVAAYLKAQDDVSCATCCYTGLVTDTGRFQYQNSTPQAFRVAAEMVQAGVDAAAVSREIFQNRSKASVALEGLAIDRMILGANGSFALSWVTSSDMVEHEATKSDTEPLIDALRSIAGVRVACMLREQAEEVRGSFRAKDDTDVRSLAQRFGGGGHRAAAGFSLPLPLTSAIQTIEEALIDLLSTQESLSASEVNQGFSCDETGGVCEAR